MSDVGSWGFGGPNQRGFDLPEGSSVTPSPPGRVRLRFNEVTMQVQASVDGGPYADFGGISPSNPDIVSVFSTGDLPTPVAGVYTLDSSKVYLFQDIIDLGTNRIDLNGSVVRGIQARVTGITTDNASAAIFATAGGNILDFFIENPLGPGFDLAGQIAIVANCRIANSASVGRIGNCALGFQVYRIVSLNNQSGLEIDGTIGTADVDTVSFISAAAAPAYIGIDFTANAQIGYIRVHDNNFILNNASDFAFRLDAAANLGTAGGGQPGYFNGNSLQGAGSAFSGFNQTDVRVIFSENGGIPDSDVVGQMTIVGNATETVISTSGAFVNIGTGATSPPHVAFSLDALSEKFSLVGAFPNQELQYDGLRTEVVNLTTNVVLEKVGGGTRNLSVRMLLNGTEIPAATREVGVSGAETSISSSVLIQMNTGDRIRPQVANLSNTSNIIVRASNILASRSN